MPRIPTIRNYRQAQRLMQAEGTGMGSCRASREAGFFLLDSRYVDSLDALGDHMPERIAEGDLFLIGPSGGFIFGAGPYIPILTYHPCGRITIDTKGNMNERVAEWINKYTHRDFKVSASEMPVFGCYRIYDETPAAYDFYDGVIIERDGSIRPRGEETLTTPEPPPFPAHSQFQYYLDRATNIGYNQVTPGRWIAT